MRCEGSIAVTPPVVVYVSRRIGASLRADQTYCYSTGADVALCALVVSRVSTTCEPA